MKRRNFWTGICVSLGMLALILDGRTAIEGARQGIELCLRTVIPSLFPFFVLSILLTSSLLGSSLIVLRPLGRLFGMPEGAESLLIPAFLGGYPVGRECRRRIPQWAADKTGGGTSAFFLQQRGACVPVRHGGFHVSPSLDGLGAVGHSYCGRVIRVAGDSEKFTAPVRLTKTSPHSPFPP